MASQNWPRLMGQLSMLLLCFGTRAKGQESITHHKDAPLVDWQQKNFIMASLQSQKPQEEPAPPPGGGDTDWAPWTWPGCTNGTIAYNGGVYFWWWGHGTPYAEHSSWGYSFPRLWILHWPGFYKSKWHYQLLLSECLSSRYHFHLSPERICGSSRRV